jgi:glycerophosphoryl diester phosphodiesterase
MAIASLTMPELSEVRLGDRERPSRIPTLRDLFLRYGSEGRYLVEMKAGPTPRPGLLEHRVAELLAHFRLFDKAMVLCFSADMLRRIKEQEPEVATCLNFDATTYRPLGSLIPDLPKGCDAIGPHVALATDPLLAEAKAANLAVHVWTVNDATLAAHLAVQGVSSIITDVPAEIGPAVRAVTGRPAPLEVV